MFNSLGYDPNMRMLEVEFKNGSVYRYYDVPYEEVRRLTSANSLGVAFNKWIKPRYNWERVRFAG